MLVVNNEQKLPLSLFFRPKRELSYCQATLTHAHTNCSPDLSLAIQFQTDSFKLRECTLTNVQEVVMVGGSFYCSSLAMDTWPSWRPSEAHTKTDLAVRNEQ